MTTHRYVRSYVRVLHQLRFLVLFLFVAGTIVGGFFLSKFLDSTRADFNAPSDAPSVVAAAKKRELFPTKRQHSSSSMIMFSFSPPTSNTNSNKNNNNKKCPLLSSTMTLAADQNSNEPAVAVLSFFIQNLTERLQHKVHQQQQQKVTVVNYVDLVQKEHADEYAASRWIADDNLTVLAPVQFEIFSEKNKNNNNNASSTMSDKQFANFLVAQVSALQDSVLQDPAALKQIVVSESASSSRYSTCTETDWNVFSTLFQPPQTTGMTLLSAEMVSAGKSDMTKVDEIAIPTALFALGITVSSLRMTGLGVCAIGLTLVLSFAIMSGVSQTMTVSTAAPSLMMSISISTSTDFVLFTASRFINAVARNRERGAAAVASTLSSAGGTIILSGSCFALSLLPLVAMPTQLVASFGLASFVTVLCSMMVCLVFLPALLLSFPSFFEESAKPLKQTWVWRMLCSRCRNDDDDDENNFHGEDDDAAAARFNASAGSVQSPWRNNEDGTDSSTIGVSSTVATGAGGAASGGGGAVNSSNLTGHSLSTMSPHNSELHSGTLYFDAPLLGGAGKVGGVSPRGSSNPNSARSGGGGGLSARAGSASLRGSVYMTQGGGGAAYHEVVVNSSWFRFLSPVVRTRLGSVSVVVFVVGIAAVCAWVAMTQMLVASQLTDYLPRDCEQREILGTLQNRFGFPAIDPLSLVFTVKNSSSSSSNILDHVAVSQTILRHIATATSTPIAGFSAPFLIGGRDISAAVIRQCLSSNNKSSSNNLCPDPNVALVLRSGGINTARTAFSVDILQTGGVNPVGPHGKNFYDKLRSASKWRPSSSSSNSNSNNLEILVVGGSFETLDVITGIYKSAPWLAVAAAAAVVVLIGFAFKSIAVPLRVLFCAAMTEAVCFGCAVLVFQNGALEWTGIAALRKTGAISWLPPLVGGCIALGVALDLDVFLLIEIRNLLAAGGVGTKDAAFVALCSSGSTITAAGLVLSLVFGTLALWPEMAVLNQMGWLVLVAAIFDTLVVRSLFVPAFFFLVGEAAWWPSKPAQEHFVPSLALGGEDESAIGGASPMPSPRSLGGYVVRSVGGGGSPIRGAVPRGTSSSTLAQSRSRLDALTEAHT